MERKNGKEVPPEGSIRGLNAIKLDHAFSFAKCNMKVAASYFIQIS
jgi:hypothetical protein